MLLALLCFCMTNFWLFSISDMDSSSCNYQFHTRCASVEGKVVLLTKTQKLRSSPYVPDDSKCYFNIEESFWYLDGESKSWVISFNARQYVSMKPSSPQQKYSTKMQLKCLLFWPNLISFLSLWLWCQNVTCYHLQTDALKKRKQHFLWNPIHRDKQKRKSPIIEWLDKRGFRMDTLIEQGLLQPGSQAWSNFGPLIRSVIATRMFVPVLKVKVNVRKGRKML